MPTVARPVTPAGILAERLAHVRARAARLHPTDGPLVAELDAARALAAGLERYAADCTSPPSPALAAIARRTREKKKKSN